MMAPPRAATDREVTSLSCLDLKETRNSQLRIVIEPRTAGKAILGLIRWPRPIDRPANHPQLRAEGRLCSGISGAYGCQPGKIINTGVIPNDTTELSPVVGYLYSLTRVASPLCNQNMLPMENRLTIAPTPWLGINRGVMLALFSASTVP